MGLDYNVVYEQLTKYLKDARALKTKSNQTLPEEIKDFFPPQISTMGPSITELGKSIEELCRDAFEGGDKENDPFYGIGYAVNVNDSEVKKTQHRESHNRMMLNTLLSFIKRKIDKTSRFLDSEIYEKEENMPRDSPSTPQQSTTIGNIEKYVAGNEINITQITNILQTLEKEIEDEPNLNEEQKQELHNLIKEESTRWDKVKQGFVKYGGAIYWTSFTFVCGIA